MGVSIKGGTPKWMVYNGTFFKMDDLGVPLLMETCICSWDLLQGRLMMNKTTDLWPIETL